MQNDEKRIAVFIDFENVAMGVRESKYGNFNIELVLKRLVEKGKIMVKRAYSDWHRYAEFKRAFHQAAIELIDVPQTRYSGKNSADIRMVVDALDLSYQKEHIDTFVLVSGDSDFSPLVSKLRENGRYVIGMGVKQSSSDLLINNCDEFIFYEDLVRPATSVTVVDPQVHHLSPKKAEAIRLVLETFQALQREGKEVIYGSMIKQTLIRKLPSFNESYYGYPMFSRLLEDAAENKLLKLVKDQKSGGYVVMPPSEAPAATPVAAEAQAPASQVAEAGANGSAGSQTAGAPSEPRDRFRRGRWDRGRSRRGDRYGDASLTKTPMLPAQPAAEDSASVPAEATRNPPKTFAGQSATIPVETDASSAAKRTEPEVAPPVDFEPVSVQHEEKPPEVEATVPPAQADRSRRRGRGRPQRFRQAANAGSRNKVPAAPKSGDAGGAMAASAHTSMGPATSQPESGPNSSTHRKSGSDEDPRPGNKSSKGKTSRRSRPPRSQKSGVHKKKPA
ncbi:MAG: NYN domain-containing protein [Acidobacteria bacterium]|nr:NYN domain-containing protein [Acidobacteriota bacterium]MCI0621600.1 NYN domain-containing protein [Acidobacteriota bacterium]MCI0718122.1 NYN domain-containing protein [Acidobacteriota bacterium]